MIAAYANSGIDWNEAGALHTVDDRTVQEAVVLMMMPGRALRAAQKDFISVVEHLAGAQQANARAEPTNEEPTDDEDLLSQLGGESKRATRTKRSDDDTASPGKRAFNPLVGARPISSHDKG